MKFPSKLADVETSIFAVMTQMANENNAIMRGTNQTTQKKTYLSIGNLARSSRCAIRYDF